MEPILQALTALILGLSACYFFGMVWLGVRASWARDAPLRAQASIRYEQPGASLDVTGADPTALDRFHVYYLIPCLDEELVIGSTVSFLPASSEDSTVIVIDDASNDRTAEMAARDDGVVVVRRRLPDARVGKGPALNAGFRELLRLVHARGHDPSRVIVVVMDADGRLSEGALSVVLPLFDDPTIGGAQLAVRIRNRDNWVTRFQNFQFWTMSAMTQLGRIRTGTVSLGGNGQFARLSALLELGPEPWNPSLTEDLDLTIGLITQGWRTTSTPHASVDQQGVETVKRLLNQRTRWYQGHMMAGRRIPDIWNSSRLTHGAAVETIMYLLVPWLLDLPWSVLYHVAVFRLALHLVDAGDVTGPSGVLGIALLYLVAFYPALITGFLCHRRDPDVGRIRSLALGHSFVVMNYLSWACSWRALYRIARRRNGWDKTSRTAEVLETAHESGSEIQEDKIQEDKTEVDMTGQVSVVLGTRPEAIKLFVLVEQLGGKAEIVHTGQHFDDNLASGVAGDLALRTPDIQLRLGGISRGAQIGRATDALSEAFRSDRPGVVVVQGDTNSALAGALAANSESIPLVHVEAGLRSYDRAMPEEHNRVLIDHIADACAAPTDLAAEHLALEGISQDRILVTGNTVVEAVQRMLPTSCHRAQLLEKFDLVGVPFVVATLHRPENVDSEPALRASLEGLRSLSVPVLFPMHPRTAARMSEFGLVDLAAGMRIIPPQLPSDFLALAKEASLLISDSGGIQEEASVLKRRVLVVRRSTERPEAMGTFADLIRPEQIGPMSAAYLSRPDAGRKLEHIPSPFGDGRASERIADIALRLAEGR